MAATRRGEARTGDDQGDMEGAVIGEVAVGHLAVFAERFAVVGGEDDERLGQELPPPELAEEGAELVVDISDLPRIGIVPMPGEERFGRRVGRVRVPEVDPAEPFPALAGQPGPGGPDDLGGPAFFDLRPGGRTRGERVVIDVEAPLQAEAGIQGKSPDEGARGISLGLEVAGHGRAFRGESGLGILADAVIKRSHARQDVGMGRQGGRVVGEGPLEEDAPRGQVVDRGRRGAARGVAAQPVGPQGVDRDEEDMGLRGPGGPGNEEQPGCEEGFFPKSHGHIIQ